MDCSRTVIELFRKRGGRRRIGGGNRGSREGREGVGGEGKGAVILTELKGPRVALLNRGPCWC